MDNKIEKMKRQPNGIRPKEAEKVLKANGYEYKRRKGSHRHDGFLSGLHKANKEIVLLLASSTWVTNYLNHIPADKNDCCLDVLQEIQIP